MSVVPERINGFSVNMTVSLDLHSYEGGERRTRSQKKSFMMTPRSDNQNLIA